MTRRIMIAWMLALSMSGATHAQMVEISNNSRDLLPHWLDTSARFGHAIAPLGDVNGDGVPDVAVSEPNTLYGPSRVLILFLNASGSVDSLHTLEPLDPDGSGFGFSLAGLGDLNEDGTPDLAISEVDQDGMCFHIYFLTPSGAPSSTVRIGTPEVTPFYPSSPWLPALGFAGDLTGDGIADVAVGDPHDWSGGRVFVYHLQRDGGLLRKDEISGVTGTVPGPFGSIESFGSSIDSLGDLDGDGLPELVIGASRYQVGSERPGSVWIVSMGYLGRVRWSRLITQGESGFVGPLHHGSFFGSAVASAGDRNGDGIPDLIVGSSETSSSGSGSAWFLNLAPDGTVIAQSRVPDSDYPGRVLTNTDLGHAVGNLGDLDGDLRDDHIIGGPYVNTSGVVNSGAIYVRHGFHFLYLDLQMTVFDADPELQQYVFTASAMNFEEISLQANVWVQFANEEDEVPDMEPVFLKAGDATPLKVTGALPTGLDEGTQVTLCVGQDPTDIWAMTSVVID